MGRSGAGRLFWSRTLTRTLTRLTLTRMRPRWAVGSCEASLGAAGVGWTIKPGSPTGDELGVVGLEAGAEVGAEFDAEFEVAFELDLGFWAQGGRSGLSWLRALQQ